MTPYVSKELKRHNHLITEIEGVYHEMALKLGLSDSAMAILYTICNQGESCLLQDICRQSGLSKQTINSALRKLEAENVLYLEMAGSRNKNVVLTESGKALARRTALQLIQIENEIFASWTQEDVDKFLKQTEEFLEALKERSKELRGVSS